MSPSHIVCPDSVDPYYPRHSLCIKFRSKGFYSLSVARRFFLVSSFIYQLHYVNIQKHKSLNCARDLVFLHRQNLLWVRSEWISPVCRGDLLWDREGLTCSVETICNSQAEIMKLFNKYHFHTTVKQVPVLRLKVLGDWHGSREIIFTF